MIFITTLSQDIFYSICYIHIGIFEFYYLYVCTFMAIGNTSLMGFVNKQINIILTRKSFFVNALNME